MPSAQWLELLCKHIPDRNELLVRYVGRLLEPRSRCAQGEGRTRGDDLQQCDRSPERVREPRQGRLGAAHLQGV